MQFLFYRFHLIFIIIHCFIFPAAATNDRPKIYDCFTFFNELEILEIKLNELYQHVDYFVLVESTETFRGNPKPLYFSENKERFSQFLDKIIHVVLTENITTNDPWSREFFQRNQILRGLTACNDEDIIIIEDLDEIIRASRVMDLITLLDLYPFVVCDQNIYTYYLNRYGHGRGTTTRWFGSAITRFAYVKQKLPQGIREDRYKAHVLDDAGWHFTYMGGIERVIKKLENFSHSELDNETYKNHQRIREEVEALQLIEIDESFPQFVQENIPYLKKLGLIDEG